MPTETDLLTAPQLEQIPRQTFVRQVEFRQTLRSTSDLALELARGTDLATPLLVLAEHQTHGRGRGNNRWWSATGSLTFSLVVDLPAARSANYPSPQVSLASALSVCLAIKDLVPHVHPGIKWPNDVFLGGRKLAGILVEIPHAARPRTIVGVGVNMNNSLRSAPIELQHSGVSLLDATGQAHSRIDLLVSYLNHFKATLALLASDTAGLADEWQSLCLVTGKSVEVRAGKRQISGTCLGIDHEGALVVETVSGTVRCYSGQVRLVQGSRHAPRL
jgi:BirA family biotin operon repressor/biotin-[acetyl-CoA-carboxylase] ligase